MYCVVNLCFLTLCKMVLGVSVTFLPIPGMFDLRCDIHIVLHKNHEMPAQECHLKSKTAKILNT